MNRSLLKIELIKFRFLIAVWLIVINYGILYSKPLMSFDLIACGLGLLQGLIAGFIVFKDFGGVESFMFSRSFTRNSLFWHRWCVGMGLLFVTLAGVALIIASGLRSLFFSRSAYQPMIKWHELNVLWSMAFGMFSGFSVAMFFVLRHRILCPEKADGPKAISKWNMPSSTIPLVFGLVLIPIIFTDSDQVAAVLPLCAWLYLIAIVVVTTFAGRQCFLKMEINS